MFRQSHGIESRNNGHLASWCSVLYRNICCCLLYTPLARPTCRASPYHIRTYTDCLDVHVCTTKHGAGNQCTAKGSASCNRLHSRPSTIALSISPVAGPSVSPEPSCPAAMYKPGTPGTSPMYGMPLPA